MKVKHLKQASVVMPKKSERTYLEGVYIDGANIIATDGHRAVHCVTGELKKVDPVIVPYHVVKQFLACAGNLYSFDIQDNKIIADGIIISFEPIIGAYPDINQTLLSYKYETSVENISFNPKYLADIYKVFKSEAVVFEFEGVNMACRIHDCMEETAYYLAPCRSDPFRKLQDIRKSLAS